MLLIGPATEDNQFNEPILYYENSTYKSPTALENTEVQFVLPPDESGYSQKRHSNRAFGHGNAPFKMSAFPSLITGFTVNQNVIYNSGSNLGTVDEEGYSVAVGYALPETNLGTWLLVFEQTHGEVWSSISQLRVILLACILGTAGGLLFIVYPMAHLFVRPIRRLREATAKSIDPLTFSDDALEQKLFPVAAEREIKTLPRRMTARSSGFKSWVSRRKAYFRVRKPDLVSKEGQLVDGADVEDGTRQRSRMSARTPRIPQKVKDGKHIIHDEVTDLTETFNEMSDELVQQYTKLEERVRLRTSELEAAKRQAEAANESKTLFIANISHELKTPLNGILGIATVAMHEDDPGRLKRHLNTIYESGDLLHKLLTDLLLFSKNQQAHYLSLDEKEFRVRDMVRQLRALFDSQAKENGIQFDIAFPHDDVILPGHSRLRDMALWGDLQRVLQVLINLISNSLKFTPAGGTVSVNIRASPATPEPLIKLRQSASMSSTRPKPADLGKKASQTSFGRTPSIMDGDPLIIEFEVVDTGPGIPDHLQERIFEPFIQGDLRLTKKFGG